MATFNFGSIKQPGKKVRPKIKGKCGPIIRNPDGYKLTPDDIAKVARMYYIDDASIDDIADSVGSTFDYINSITKGQSNSKSWEGAVMDMVVAGIEVKRRTDPDSVDGKSKKARLINRRQIPADKVIKIREMHSQGLVLRDIGRAVKIRESTVRDICKKRTYKSPEYFPKGMSNG